MNMTIKVFSLSANMRKEQQKRVNITQCTFVFLKKDLSPQLRIQMRETASFFSFLSFPRNVNELSDVHSLICSTVLLQLEDLSRFYKFLSNIKTMQKQGKNMYILYNVYIFNTREEIKREKEEERDRERERERERERTRDRERGRVS